MGRVYATKEQLEVYLEGEPVPDGAARLLRSASRDVDDMLLTAVYAVDAAGMPTDPGVAEALREATCLQAMHRDEHGDEIQMMQAGEAASLGPLSLGTGAGNAGSVSIPRWNPEAFRVLRLAGLIPGTVRDG
ncbi:MULTISPECIES: hypothetical protein [unclassified Leucobacter]|uniref:hypothetical protein n=1 Tax=unclassified Leucobacter TaxID=2621730 RepID=UPI0006217558|nr:hypothetical protein [Leucobacter sp. Ag1]KKI18715.1 hypothetical protein XM48_10560 [Leucobacter sp. Ag1]